MIISVVLEIDPDLLDASIDAASEQGIKFDQLVTNMLREYIGQAPDVSHTDDIDLDPELVPA